MVGLNVKNESQANYQVRIIKQPCKLLFRFLVAFQYFTFFLCKLVGRGVISSTSVTWMRVLYLYLFIGAPINVIILENSLVLSGVGTLATLW